MKILNVTPLTRKELIIEVLEKINEFPCKNGIECNKTETIKWILSGVHSPTPQVFILAVTEDSELIGHVLLERQKRYGVSTLFIWQIEKYDSGLELSDEFRKKVVDKIKLIAKRNNINSISAVALCEKRAEYFTANFGFSASGVCIEMGC